MSRDPLLRLLLRVAIGFLAVQVAIAIVCLAVFVFLFLGGEPPVFGDGLSGFDLSTTTGGP